MRVAITYENGLVFQHFGHTQKFKIYDIENQTIILSIIINTNDSGHGALANLLKTLNVDILICGGIGGGARNALQNVGITLYGGVQGNVDDIIQDFMHNKLSFNPDITCHHHDHHEDGNCGEHSCGNHSCH